MAALLITITGLAVQITILCCGDKKYASKSHFSLKLMGIEYSHKHTNYFQCKLTLKGCYGDIERRNIYYNLVFTKQMVRLHSRGEKTSMLCTCKGILSWNTSDMYTFNMSYQK